MEQVDKTNAGVYPRNTENRQVVSFVPTLTVVIPCYNEASRGTGVKSFYNRLAKVHAQLATLDYKVLLMDDGSTDNSVEVFRKFVRDNNVQGSWTCLSTDKNYGKGSAVWRGIEYAKTDYILLLDADLSVEPSAVIPILKEAWFNACFVGTRYAPQSVIVNKRSSLRRFISFCCRILVGLLFGINVSDTQCGFKLLPTVACKNLTTYAKNTWLYDVEILYNLKCRGVTIKETPISWNNMERESNINALGSIIPSTLALFKLFLKKGEIKKLYKYQH